MRDDILECSVLLPKSTRDYAQSNKTELAIQCKSAFIRPDDGVELQNTESALLSLIDGMADKCFSNVMSSPF